jgi:hypothetical protein
MADAVSLALYLPGYVARKLCRKAREVRRWAVGWCS